MLNEAFSYTGDSNTSWIRALTEMRKLPVNILCPGHESSDITLIDKQRRYFVELREFIGNAISKGIPLAEIKKDDRFSLVQDWTGVAVNSRRTSNSSIGWVVNDARRHSRRLSERTPDGHFASSGCRVRLPCDHGFDGVVGVDQRFSSSKFGAWFRICTAVASESQASRFVERSIRGHFADASGHSFNRVPAPRVLIDRGFEYWPRVVALATGQTRSGIHRRLSVFDC